MPAGKTVGPYTYVSHDSKRKFENGRTFRVLIAGAFNAMGLIGSESNGIVILDEDKKRVLADEIMRQGTGWFGPSQKQLDVFEAIQTMPWTHFQALVNNSGRNRYKI